MTLISPRNHAFTTSNSTIDFGQEMTLLIIKNDGAGNAFIDFDTDANTSNAPLNSGETISFDLKSNDSKGVRRLGVIGSANGTLRIWGASKDE